MSIKNKTNLKFLFNILIWKLSSHKRNPMIYKTQYNRKIRKKSKIFIKQLMKKNKNVIKKL